ncbi:FMN-binding negative transcriptional regulator [Paraglaciecola sp.]|uniref:FMN-binding negative transcriptional regulator n=1 Tax=Paraglaciecola sp. TaxID=1920173 RepID=UPI003EF8D5D4
MFIPKHFEMAELSQQQQFINEFSFGVMTSDSLQTTHLPFLLDAEMGEKGTLFGHIARANSHWKELDSKRVLVVFNGPHSYISPTWFMKSPAVPTWNYAAVHVYGVVRVLDKTETLKVLENTMAKYEPELLNDSSVVTAEYVDKLSAAIVGFKIELTELQGVAKVGQHKSLEDQKLVCSRLSQSAGSDEKALANFMLRYNLGVGE